MRWSAFQSSPPPSTYDRIFGRTVRLWLVAAVLLFSILWSVVFAWYVKRSVFLDDQSPVALAAVEVASFPTTVKKVLLEVGRILSGAPDYVAFLATPPDYSLSGFVPVKSKLKGIGEGLIVRRGPGTPAVGWRVIAGSLRVNGTLQTAAVLLSPDLEIVHYWPLVEDGALDVDFEPPTRTMPHGLSVLADGSVIYNLDNGNSLNRKDKCGHTIWALPGDYNHALTLDDTEATVWGIRIDEGNDLAEQAKIVQVATADGKILKAISVAAIIAANPKIDVLELRRYHEDKVPDNARKDPGRWLSDPFHLNDVDPLPRTLAGKFPMFAPGDLLISAREINLVFVMDPASLAIKWWSVGSTIRQHDADWNSDGQISIFNNRMTREYSEIVEIDPATKATKVAVDGRPIDFYSRHRGNHQRLPGGGWLITSTDQGRIIEVSPSGEIALEFYDQLKDKPQTNTVLSSAIFFPEGTVKPGAFQCGEN